MRVLTALAFAILMTGCGRKTAPAHSAEWGSYINAFLESTFAANPDLAVYEGRHEFDGKLPDWSPQGIQREIDRLKAERAKAVAFDPKTLDDRQRFERDYATNVIDGRLFWLASAEWPFKNPSYYGGSLDPNVYGRLPCGQLTIGLFQQWVRLTRIPEAV